MMCDLIIGIEWEILESMNEFFQECNDHVKNRYAHLFNQPERLNPEDCDHRGINIMKDLYSVSKKFSKCNSIFTICDSLSSMET